MGRLISLMCIAIIASSCQSGVNDDRRDVVICDYVEYPLEYFYVDSDGRNFTLEYKLVRIEQDSLFYIPGKKGVFRKILQKYKEDSSLFVSKILWADAICYPTTAEVTFEMDSITGTWKIIEENETNWILQDSTIIPGLILDRKYPMSQTVYSGLLQILDDIMRSDVTNGPCMDGVRVEIVSSAEPFAKKFSNCDEEADEWHDRLANYFSNIRSGK